MFSTKLHILHDYQSFTPFHKSEVYAYSTCPTGKNGGSLGSFGPGQMVPQFDDVVFRTGRIKEVCERFFAIGPQSLRSPGAAREPQPKSSHPPLPQAKLTPSPLLPGAPAGGGLHRHLVWVAPHLHLLPRLTPPRRWALAIRTGPGPHAATLVGGALPARAGPTARPRPWRQRSVAAGASTPQTASI